MRGFDKGYFDSCVYPRSGLKEKYPRLPGYSLIKPILVLDYFPEHDIVSTANKIEQYSRKVCYMWKARNNALSAKDEFLATTIKDSVSLFGDHQIEVQFYLESLVLFARSSLDISSAVFSQLLPDPFKRKRIDSFNDLVKIYMKDENAPLAQYLTTLRDNPKSWLSFVANISKGRSLLDKIVHQTEFPIDFIELYPPSQREYPVVRLHDKIYIELMEFLDEIERGVIEGLLKFEDECLIQLEKMFFADEE